MMALIDLYFMMKLNTLISSLGGFAFYLMLGFLCFMVLLNHYEEDALATQLYKASANRTRLNEELHKQDEKEREVIRAEIRALRKDVRELKR